MAGERVATYEYDGLFRRVAKTVGNQGSGPVYKSNVNMTGIEAGNRHEHYYYSGWRLMEMQDDATPSSRTLNQFVCGTQYIDEPVVYDRNTDVSADDDCLDAAGSQRYTYHQDANYRVVGLTAEDGTVVERYQYTAYGEPTVYLGGATEAGNALPVSSVGNPFMHQGLYYDREIRGYQNRFRQMGPERGRHFQAEPLSYASGLNMFEYLGSAPMAFIDYAGLRCEEDGPTTQPEPNECEKIIDAILSNNPATPAGGRLHNAYTKSGVNALYLWAIAYVESEFGKNLSNPKSTAQGPFQILEGTADDVQDRIWPNHVVPKKKDGPSSGPSGDASAMRPPFDIGRGERLTNYRNDYNVAAGMAWLVLLDRIAAAGNDLTKGLDRFGTGPGYGNKIKAGVAAIKKVCGFKKDRPTMEEIRDCAKNKCDELKKALAEAVR